MVKLLAFVILANILQIARDRANITIAIRYEVRYFPLHGAIVNIVHRDNLYFQGYNVS